jgi:Ni/Co efflux regulator RcnB
MSESEAISRRKALSLVGLAAAFGLAAAPAMLTPSDAKAQEAAEKMTGTERRQARRTHRVERREERRTHRVERREERRMGREERREIRKKGRMERHELRHPNM